MLVTATLSLLYGVVLQNVYISFVWLHVYVSICLFVVISCCNFMHVRFLKFVLPTGVINHNNKNNDDGDDLWHVRIQAPEISE